MIASLAPNFAGYFMSILLGVIFVIMGIYGERQGRPGSMGFVIGGGATIVIVVILMLTHIWMLTK